MSRNILFTRQNAILGVRSAQLTLNFLAVRGGTPYVDARLWRAPNESDLSWTGTSAFGRTVGTVGRKQRACCINDAGRVSEKINQYLFATAAKRSGIDETFAKDVTATGQSVGAFWEDVSEAVTAGCWCWVQVDRAAPEIDAATGRPRQRSRADRERAGDRIRWILWPAHAVVDWCFDSAGRLKWLLTEEEAIDNSDPLVEPVVTKRRRLWQRGEPGGATWESWEETAGGEAKQVASGTISTPEIPFVIVGQPSSLPWWFDTVESIQAQSMNLDSLHIENLTRTVFGQLVIPQSSLDSLEARLIERAGTSNGERVLELVREVVRGLDAPMIESAEESGITRFIQPSASDLAALPDEVKRKRQMLFDTAGLALFNKESRQVQTAESKQFDHLDTEATLRRRALMLQEAEASVVAVSVAMDSTFAVYAPEWPDSFDVTDVSSESGALAEIGQISNLTLTQRKLVLHAATRLLAKMTRITEEHSKAIQQEIDALEDDDFDLLPPRIDTPVDTPAS
jgi:hypothetical protein